MDVLIVGAGSMGRWFARSIDAAVAFADIDPEAAAGAASDLDGDVARLEDDDSYDAVCIAVPMDGVEAAIDDHASRADRALLDVSGVMEEPLAAMAAAAPGRERVSLHPLFAAERAPGSVAVVRARDGPVTDALLASLADRGNELVETTARDHDRAMETVQAATHAAVLSFALAAEPVPDGFSTPVYDELRSLAERVTDGTPRVYADIQRTFDGADAVAAAAEEIATADDAAFESLYRRAGRRLEETAEGGDSR